MLGRRSLRALLVALLPVATAPAGMAAAGRGAAAGARPDGAARPAPDAAVVRHAVAAHLAIARPAILSELADLLAIPNVASHRDDLERNADRLRKMMRQRGIAARLLEVPDAPPVVYGEVAVPGAVRTVVFYAHYDGQPVDPGTWSSHPWTPVLRDRSVMEGGVEIAWPETSAAFDDEWRLYARSASDDKAPIVALLAALDALRAAGIDPAVNLKFFLEGEEESGSPNLARLLEAHAAQLEADLWLMCDGPRHQSRRMQVFFGVRGIIDLELTLYGPLRPLHSGHYGNWAPNPIGMLAHLLADLRDPEGTVLIPGFYDAVRPLSDAERRALRGIPDRREALMDDLALSRTEGEGRSLEAAILRPAMNLRGIAAGGVGALSRNAISTEARASIDFRLVPDQTPDRVRHQLESFLRERGYHVVHADPDPATRRAYPRVVKLEWGQGYPPSRAPLADPMSRAVVQVLQEAIEAPIVEMPTLGGSLPLYVFETVLDTPTIGVPIVNHDNNQHAADENLRLGNLWEGIALYAALMARLGPEWDERSISRDERRGD